MLATAELTEIQWQIAHAIAQTLVQDDADVNELSKAIAYLRAYAHQEKAGSRFFDYLKTLERNGRQIGHSSKTSEYYGIIEKACTKYLKAFQNDVPAMLQILGWAARLMRYYKNAGPIGEITAPVIDSVRQAEIASVMQSQKFAVDQILDAEVMNIKKGNMVTYQILETIRLTEKEPKKASLLTEGQKVKVRIGSLKEDGSIKSVKYAD